MLHATMRRDAVGAATGYFYPKLLECEDMDRFEELVASGGRSILAEAMTRSLEAFDAKLREDKPRSWSVHERAERTLITLVGEVRFTRTVFLDENGRRRTLADELLGIPKRARLSTGAFLWIVRRAAEESYRKTAEAFTSASGCALSHVTVMNCVRAEGDLLKAADAPSGQRISQDTLFLEVDGLWVHLQEHEHRNEALPRFLYEQTRKTVSFELKIAALYAGKRKVAPGRYARDGLALTCSKGDAETFWEETFKLVEDSYELDDVERIWLGADGGGWSGPGRLEEKVPEGCEVSCSLDPFHIMQKICRAFPEGPQRDWAVNLAVRRKPLRLARMCRRAAPKVKSERRTKRMRELESYMESNASAVRFPRPSLGTMEGTNAHVGAARLKGQGRSWSRAGAEAMCLVRCALATGRALLAPDKGALFTQKEQQAAFADTVRSARGVQARVGRGYLPPHQAATGSLKTAAGFRARSC